MRAAHVLSSARDCPPVDLERRVPGDQTTRSSWPEPSAITGRKHLRSAPRLPVVVVPVFRVPYTARAPCAVAAIEHHGHECDDDGDRERDEQQAYGSRHRARSLLAAVLELLPASAGAGFVTTDRSHSPSLPGAPPHGSLMTSAYPRPVFRGLRRSPLIVEMLLPDRLDRGLAPRAAGGQIRPVRRGCRMLR